MSTTQTSTNVHAVKPGDVLPGKDGATYRILKLIGAGGFSVVHEAECEQTKVHYAVKSLQMRHNASEKAQTRQHREAKTLRKLRHPNVVQVHYIGVREEDGLIFMVMDLLVGRTLRELQRDLGGRLPIPWALEIMIQVCDGLDAIHEHATHRDVKPDNTHIGDDGRVCLFDLGAAMFPKEARITTGGMTVGTVLYMSPEQLYDTGKLDGRSDLFAVGAILYELCGGVHPFAKNREVACDTMVLGNRIIFQPHTPFKDVAPHVPSYLIEIVERSLKKKPHERYHSARDLLVLLKAAHRRYCDDLGALAPPPLASVIAGIPKALGPRVGDASDPSSPSLNPFLTISLPQETGTAAGHEGATSAETVAPPAQDGALATTDPTDTGAFAQAMEAAQHAEAAAPADALVTEPVDTGAFARAMEAAASAEAGLVTEPVDTRAFAQAMEAASTEAILKGAPDEPPADAPCPPRGQIEEARPKPPPERPRPLASPHRISRRTAVFIVAWTALVVTLVGLNVARWLGPRVFSSAQVAPEPSSPLVPAVPPPSASASASAPASAPAPASASASAPAPASASAPASAPAFALSRPPPAPARPAPRATASSLPPLLFDFDPPAPPAKGRSKVPPVILE